MKQTRYVRPWKPRYLVLISPAFYWLIILTFQPLVLAEKLSNNPTHHEHGEHEGHAEEALSLSVVQLQEFGIKMAQAKPGIIFTSLDLTGEIIIAPEYLYHVVPQVSGVVRQVFKHLGDKVKANDLLATLSSRDLANTKAEFVAADSLLQLANTNLKRERSLYNSKVTAKSAYLAAKQMQAEMSIKRKAAEQRLLAIGINTQAILSVLHNTDKDLTLYQLHAPADGVIIEKHAVQGEVLDTTARSFTIADLSRVWINLTVYQKDLPLIQQGQQVMISTRFGLSAQESTTISSISWLSPILDETTRSATARVVIDNPNGNWRPGLFVRAQVALMEMPAEIVVPVSVLQNLKGQTVVFVRHENGDFEPQTVQIGRSDFLQVEILQGLQVGQTYVSQNAFVLKAQLQKAEFAEGHSH